MVNSCAAYNLTKAMVLNLEITEYYILTVISVIMQCFPVINATYFNLSLIQQKDRGGLIMQSF